MYAEKGGPMRLLKVSEINRLQELEMLICKKKKAFVEVGQHLTEIRDRKLWEHKYSSFREYCETVWGWGKRYTNQIMGAAAVVQSLPGGSYSSHIATETQAREVAKVAPEKRAKVVEAAKAKADVEKRPMTAKDIREAAKLEPEPEETPHIRTPDEVIAEDAPSPPAKPAVERTTETAPTEAEPQDDAWITQMQRTWRSGSIAARRAFMEWVKLQDV